MRVGSRRRIPPMPIEEIVDNPTRMAMPSAARGMLDDLLYHFWSSECRPMPKDGNQLFAISRGHRPTWLRHYAEILTVFEEIRPRFERAQEARAAQHATLK